MYCPQCGQQQVSDAVRFCSKCGFPLDGVIHLLHNRGMLPAYPLSEVSTEPSPRKRGVRQGGILLLTGAVLVPILGVLNSFAENSTLLDIMVAIAAIIFFLGGPLRMIYAGLFEEGAPIRSHIPIASYAPASAPVRPSLPGHGMGALPPAAVNTSAWRSRPNTAELLQPPSITENTTRLLEKEEPREH